MFKKIAIISAILAFAVCAADEPVPILSQDSNIDPDGTYSFNFETGDGIIQHQSGTFQTVGDEVIQRVEGHVKYVDPEGVPHETSYVADESGFHPESADIPVAPSVQQGERGVL